MALGEGSTFSQFVLWKDRSPRGKAEKWDSWSRRVEPLLPFSPSCSAFRARRTHVGPEACQMWLQRNQKITPPPTESVQLQEIRELWKWHKADRECQTGEGRGQRNTGEGVLGGDTRVSYGFSHLVHEVSVLADYPQPAWFLLLWGCKSQSWDHDLLRRVVLLAPGLYCSIWLPLGAFTLQQFSICFEDLLDPKFTIP